MSYIQDFEGFLNEELSDLKSLNENIDEITLLVNDCLSNFTNAPLKVKLDENGKVILRPEVIRVNTDRHGYTKLPFSISPKSRKDITFRFDRATKLETLFGFPPLPDAEFLIWKDDTTSIPKNVRDIILYHWSTIDHRGYGDFGWRLTAIGIDWFKSGLEWEEYFKQNRAKITLSGLGF